MLEPRGVCGANIDETTSSRGPVSPEDDGGGSSGHLASEIHL